MKKKLLFFIGLLCPFFIIAQNLPPDYPGKHWEHQFDPNEFGSVLDNSVRVLDSIVTTRYDNFDEEYLYEKWGWEYDDQARRIEFFVFRWDLSNDALFQSTQRNFEYLQDKTITTSYSSNNALTPLSLRFKSTDWLNDDGGISENLYELWDEDLGIWVPSSKTILTFQSDTLLVRNRYSWNENISDYELSGKIESRNYDFFLSTFYYDIDDAGQFVPDYVLEFTNNPTTGSRELYEQIRYYPDSDEWEVVTRDKTVYDFQNSTGYTTKASNWHGLGNGEFIVYDSTTFVMNADYRRTTGEGFVPNVNNLDQFSHAFNYEYEYFANGDFEERTEIQEGIFFEPYQRKHYHFSEIDVVSAHEPIAVDHQFKIIVANPSNLQDNLTISKLPEGQHQAELWICAASGKLLFRQKAVVGETINVQNLGMTNSGLYFVTLFAEGKQRTWKIVVQ